VPIEEKERHSSSVLSKIYKRLSGLKNTEPNL
jgi:hypothetical protein